MALKLRRSAVAGKVPTTAQLELGELAVNTYDGRLFLKKDDGTEEIKEIGAKNPTSNDFIGFTNRELADMGPDGDGTIAFDASEGFYGTAAGSLYASPALLWSRHNVTPGSGIDISYSATGRPTISTTGGGGIGQGQTWQGVSRSSNSTYQNTTNGPIGVSIRIYGWSVSRREDTLHYATILKVHDGSSWLDLATSGSGSNSVEVVTFVLPPGHSYRFEGRAHYFRELK